MEQFFQGLPNFIWGLAGTGVISLCGYLAYKARNFFAEHTANNQVAAEHGALKEDVAAIKDKLGVIIDGLGMVLKHEMVNEHRRLVSQKYATPTEKDNFKDMHDKYVKLDEENNSNGAGEYMRNDVMQMYSIAPSEFDEES